jgi:Ni/Fe-hydrogenase 1 B-type cytochrome subunit
MNVTSNFPSDSNQSSMFMEKHSLPIRIWHWLTFIVISASLITVLFASTVFTSKGNIGMVQEQIQQKGGMVTLIQAKAVAHEYSDKLWMLHKYFGYGLAFLLLCRIVLETVNSKEERLKIKIKNALRLSRIYSTRADTTHYLLVKYGYVFFYAILLVMATTGLGLAYEDVPWLRSIHKPLIQVHSFVQYLIYLYIVAHLVGVLRAEVTTSKGIVSGMINNGRV